MSVNFIECDRQTPYLLPPSVEDWLPNGHLARFVGEIVEQLDLSLIKANYSGRGSQPHNPTTLVALLFYGYATGVFSSRMLERSTYDSVAFRYIAANQHPDHDTIANFRKRFLKELSLLFVQILSIAHEAGVLKLGNVSLDGTKVKANASKHKAFSYKHACKLEEQIKAEVKELMQKAEAADKADIPDGLNIPAELERREERMAAIQRAKAEIERRAAERYELAKAVYEEKLRQREQRTKETGKKPRGKQPKPPVAGPTPKDQMNLTDEDSRIMPTSGGGFEQAYNAQAGVDTTTKLIISAHVTQDTNDRHQLTPALQNLESLPQNLGTVENLIADSGFYSEANVNACGTHQITPYVALGREQHNSSLWDRFQDPAPLAEDADPIRRMKHRLKTIAGKAIYALRKSTSEPVFGIIKAVMGFRSFHLRGFEAAQHEWTLVCMAWNIKRLHVLVQ